MLFKEIHLKGIKSGKITLAFRRWKKAAVQSGSLLHTAVGVVQIKDITEVDEKDITETDALKAGFTTKEQLLDSLRQHSGAAIFSMSVSYYSEDPRIKLREQTALTDAQFLELKKRLERLDNYSKQGPWTEKILLAIKDNPRRRAAEIAEQTGFDKEWTKQNIRKLKNLGLTISHEVGYELSPFGYLYVEKLSDLTLTGF